jgi:hypothetical protein
MLLKLTTGKDFITTKRFERRRDRNRDRIGDDRDQSTRRRGKTGLNFIIHIFSPSKLVFIFLTQ